MKTFSPKPADVKREWFVIDAEGQILGRLASQIAGRLRGKHKPEYAHHIDMGDFIVVINAEKIRVTGKKLDDKMYWRHTGYPGGIKGDTLRKVLDKKPEEALMHAVRGMLPRNRLGRAQLKKLKVYAGASHPHDAQGPKTLEF